MAHPFADVVIAGGFNTRQAKVLEGHTSLSIAVEAALGVLEETGIAVDEVDAVYGQLAAQLIYTLGIGPVWDSHTGGGIPAVLSAAQAIAAGACSVALVADGGAAVYSDHRATAPWTRPSNEFVLTVGMYTALEFALIARRHMEQYGTKPEHLATVAATIRNNGHVNPDAVYFGRGPYTPDDVLESRMVADPFHLLDCAMTSEGGCALVLTRADRVADLPRPPVFVLGGGADHFGPAYHNPPSWDLRSSASDEVCNGLIGRRAARRSFAAAGLGPSDVDCCELYDPFSFEIIRQLEAFELCGAGEGADLVTEGGIALDGRYPTTTDGGTMSFSHGGAAVQMLQRVIRGVHQLQRTCRSGQVDAEVVLCSNGGAGAMFNDVLLLGKVRP
jgi:acetyl-CoA acetyltransferase